MDTTDISEIVDATTTVDFKKVAIGAALVTAGAVIGRTLFVQWKKRKTVLEIEKTNIIE